MTPSDDDCAQWGRALFDVVDTRIARGGVELGSPEDLGPLGYACLYLALNEVEPSDGHVARAEQLTRDAIRSAGQGGLRGISLFGGLSGIGLVLHLLAQLGVDARSSLHKVTASVSRAVLGATSADAVMGSHHSSFDLVSGIAGPVHFLVASGTAAAATAAVAVQSFLAEDPDGDVFDGATTSGNVSAEDRQISPWLSDGYLNLGLAHGLPGVLAAFSGVTERSSTDRLRGLVIANLRETAHGLSAPSWSVPRTENLPAHTERKAWCYGNPGVAWALARAAADSADLDVVVALLDDITARDPKTWRLDAVGLCHGLAGLLMVTEAIESLHPSLASTTGPLRDAVRHELVQTLDGAALGALDPGLLNGLAGTAAGLLCSAARRPLAALNLFLPGLQTSG